MSATTTEPLDDESHRVRKLSTSSDSSTNSQETDNAKTYYDSDDAFNFYKHIWGGSCIHIGYYKHKDKGPFNANDVEKASLVSQQHLIDLIPMDITTDSFCVDLGAGYGGTLRSVVESKGCKGACIDISEKLNAENEARNERAGLGDRIRVLTRSFTDTDLESSSADVVWSQDAFLHGATEADAIFQEISRILKPGGYLVFSDIMKTDTADPNELAGILKRIHLSDLSSPNRYKSLAKKHGMSLTKEELHPDGIRVHYSAVEDVLSDKRADLPVSKQFVDNMIAGLKLWQEGSEKNDIVWGYFIFQKE